MLPFRAVSQIPWIVDYRCRILLIQPGGIEPPLGTTMERTVKTGVSLFVIHIL